MAATTNHAESLSHLLTPSTCSIVDGWQVQQHVNRSELKNAICKIHSTVDWNHYNGIAGSISRNPNNVLFAALPEKPDQIIGYISFQPGWNEAYISFMAVDSNYQNRGVGTNLMVSLMMKVQEMGISRLALDYRANKEKTAHFYHKIANITHVQIKEKNVGEYPNGDPRKELTYFLEASERSSISA